MALTIRSVKGSALTHNELDANLTTLNQERLSPTFETGDEVNFHSGGDVYAQQNATVQNFNDYNYSTIYLNSGFYYWYNPPNNYIYIISSGLYNGESALLAIQTLSPLYGITLINDDGTAKWCNSPPQFQSSGTPTANGKTAPNGGSDFDSSPKLFSAYKDSSGDVWMRYLGSFMTGGQFSSSAGYVLVP